MTPEELQQGDEEYSAAFNEDVQPPQNPGEDEVFASPESAENANSASEGMAEEDGGKGGAMTVDSEVPAVAEAADAASQPPEQDEGQADEPQDPKDMQRAKSWEGRLKAREAELAAREAALKAREAGGHNEAAEGETAAEEAAETPQTEQVEQVMDQVKSGEITPEQALNTLKQDFGDEFVSLITTLVKSAADQVASEKVSSTREEIDSLISEITNDKARAHFETIAEAHPDFAEVAESDMMKTYLDCLSEDQRAQAQNVIENGSARQIVKLLNDVKAYADKKDVNEPMDESNMAAAEAAEGVRSKGISLPAKPGAQDDYEGAWEQF